MTCEEHRDYPCTYHERLIAANSKLWTIVGEWSIATPGEFNCDGQAAFARQQIGAFEKAEGWFMWAHYNGQNMREWSFNDSYAMNWINPAGDNSPQCPSEEITEPPSPITEPPSPITEPSTVPVTVPTSPPSSASALYSDFVGVVSMFVAFVLMMV